MVRVAIQHLRHKPSKINGLEQPSSSIYVQNWIALGALRAFREHGTLLFTDNIGNIFYRCPPIAGLLLASLHEYKFL